MKIRRLTANILNLISENFAIQKRVIRELLQNATILLQNATAIIKSHARVLNDTNSYFYESYSSKY